MKTFHYTGLTPDGQRVTGMRQSSSKNDLAYTLSLDDVFMVKCRRTGLLSFAHLPRSVDHRVVSDFTATLTLLLNARVSLVDSLTMMVHTSGAPAATVSQSLLHHIRDGCSLSESAGREEAVFGRAYPALLAIGETTGNLVEVLELISESVSVQRELRERTRQLLLYPLFVVSVLIGMVSFLMIVVVPELVSFIVMSNQALPVQTRFLIAFSEMVRLYWIHTAVFVPACVLIALSCYQTVEGLRIRVDRLLINNCIVGSLLLRLKLVRFCHHMSLLLRAKVNLLDALDLSRPLFANAELERVLDDVRRQVISGSSLADAIKRGAVFPAMFCSLIEIGETSGDLTGMFVQISNVYEREARITMATLEAMITPILMICIGGIVLWVVTSVLAPVYDAVINVGGSFI